MTTTKVGVQLHPQATSVSALREAWKAADAMGVDSIWVWDHFYPLYGDPEAAQLHTLGSGQWEKAKAGFIVLQLSS